MLCLGRATIVWRAASGVRQKCPARAHDSTSWSAARRARAVADGAAALRAHGFDDVAVHDSVRIAALFNCGNGLVEGPGADPRP